MFRRFRIMVVIAVSTAVYVLARSRGVQIVRCLWYVNPRRAHFKHLQSGAFMLSGSLCACAFRLSCEVHVRFSPYHAQGSSASVARRLSHLACSQFFFPHTARPGAWWPNARSSGFARLAFSGRLSSFATLPNEGASNHLEWAEY